MIIGYGKIGRSMPLSLAKCGSLGGDVEMTATVKTLALRRPQDTFVLIGRNSGDNPQDVGLPENVINPWIAWRSELMKQRKALNIVGGMTSEDQFRILNVFMDLVGPTFESFDALVYWAGQHGTSNIPLPKVKDHTLLTKPQDWCSFYSGWMLQGVNLWRESNPRSREEIWLNADPRNYLKMRDLKWPLQHPVLAQHTYDHVIKHHRYGDGDGWEDWIAPCDVSPIRNENDGTVGTWKSTVRNVYSRLEINALSPGTPFGDLISYNEDWAGRQSFGVMVNETRVVTEAKSRRELLRSWVLPLDPEFIHGTWSPASQELLGVKIEPAGWSDYFPLLHSVRSTFTMPNSGSGWATTKPWEAFAAGVVCFFHPLYDAQSNILQDADSNLKNFLRVDSPETLARRVRALDKDPQAWLWVVRTQREHFMKAITELTYAQFIDARIDAQIGVTT